MDREKIELTGYSCMKKSVSAVIMLKSGMTYTGQNLKRIATHSCPRKHSLPGKDYHHCKVICGTFGHAEEVAIQAALVDHSKKELRGSKMWIFGNHHQCDNCKSLCKEYGIEVVAIIDRDTI